MSKLTVGEIIALLVDNEITVEQFVQRGNNWRSTTLPAELGKVNTVKSPAFEDYEEQGRYDTDTYVNHFVDHDIYLATTAQVDSYGDNETYPYGYGKEVRPVVKPTTVYE